MWMNDSLNLCQQAVGSVKYRKIINKNKEATQSCVQNVMGKKSLSYASHNCIKHVTKNRHKMSLALRRYNATGAVGYAHVVRGNPLNHLDFFGDERCYKLRFRLSNVMSKDDASSCVREAAVKFCDQDHDGPFDLIMSTGRYSLARDCNSYLKFLKLKNPEKLKKMCLSDPFFYRALVDGLRKAPDSYANLTFYSHICYRATMPDNQKKLVKFRLIPMARYEEYKDITHAQIKKCLQVKETGHLETVDQQEPWLMGKKKDGGLPFNYLKREIKTRLGKGEPVSYYLEVQVGPLIRKADYDDRNPQLLWDEVAHPWFRVMEVELTTSLSSYSIRGTSYNLTDKPKGLIFPIPERPQDPFSLQKVLMSVYTEMEMKGTGQVCDPRKSNYDGSRRARYNITVVSESLNANRPIPYVEIYVTLLGVNSRSIPLSLNNTNQHNKIWDKDRNHRREEYKVECDSVEDMLGVFVEVYYRHITEHWFLRELTVEEETRKDKKWVFPCYEVVESPVLVFPGDVCLVANVKSEASKKERIFQLKEMRVEYKWESQRLAKRSPSEADEEDEDDAGDQTSRPMPGCIMNPRKVETLPFRHRSRWIKYTGLRWEVDPRIVDFYREFRFNRALKKFKVPVKNRKVVKKRRIGMKRKGKKVGQLRPLHMRFDVLDGRRRSVVDRGSMPDGGTGGWNSEEEEEKLKRRRKTFSRQSSYAGKSATNIKLKELNKLNRLLSYRESPLSEDDEDEDGGDDEDHEHDKLRPHSKSTTDDVFDKVDGRLPAFEQRSKQTKGWPNSNLESQFPDGSPGDMCRLVDDDYKFGLSFLVGTNPRIIKRCRQLPNNFPVTDNLLSGLLERPLKTEMQEGNIYIADYEILDGLDTIHQDADHRFLAAPLVLLHLDNETKDLMPLAIQLRQEPGSLNSILTPNSPPAVWLHAKLWVRCSDFNHQFAISHLFTTHFLMEPFLISTMRCLPPCHPVCKILLPHFRNLLLSNTMIRQHLLCEKGPIDSFTSLGSKGFKQLMQKYYDRFSFKLLNPIKELESRDVLDGLPNYFYRDDSIKLFNSLLSYCTKLLYNHYLEPETDLMKDFELADWLNELHKNGFPGNRFDFFSNKDSIYTNSRSSRPSAPPRNDIEDDASITPINKQPLPSFPPSANPSPLIINHRPPLTHSPPSYYQPLDEPDGSAPLLKNLPDFSKNSSTLYDEINLTPFNEANLKKNDAYNKSDIKAEIFEKQPVHKVSYPNLAEYKHLDDLFSKDSSPDDQTISGLAELLASIIFTTTCLQSATRSDALDIFGFVPDIPAMMKTNPIDYPITIDSSYLSKLLPDQPFDAYFSSFLFILNHYRADQNIMTDIDESYFVDEASKSDVRILMKELKNIGFDQNVRNLRQKIHYENLNPFVVSASPGPLPYIPHRSLNKKLGHLGPSFSLSAFLEQRQPASTWHYVLDLCLSFHEELGGRSTRGFYASCKGGGGDRGGADELKSDGEGQDNRQKVRSVGRRSIGRMSESGKVVDENDGPTLVRGQTYDEVDRGADDVDAWDVTEQKRKLYALRGRFMSNAD